MAAGVSYNDMHELYSCFAILPQHVQALQCLQLCQHNNTFQNPNAAQCAFGMTTDKNHMFFPCYANTGLHQLQSGLNATLDVTTVY
eukprot:scaffold55163_cov22-Prasinocladus_malaysianus.AAC.1